MELSKETLLFIEHHAHEDVRTLALSAKPEAGVDLHAALIQLAGQQAAVRKLPSWSRIGGIRYPQHLSMEQCSSEVTARYKARLVEGESFADLTAGFGVDCFFLSARFQSSTYVEQQEELCEVARHNFALLGRPDIHVVQGNGTTYLRQMDPVDCLYLDPARRDAHGGKRIAIADCDPNVQELEPLLLQKGKQVLVKLSPMLDVAQALHQLPSAQAVYIVSVQNECKELLLKLSSEQLPYPQRTCHCIQLLPYLPKEKAEADTFPNDSPIRLDDGSAYRCTDFHFTFSEEQVATCAYADAVDRYLYEPNASVLKAGAFRSVAARFGLQKLHPNSHLYTAPHCIPSFPGRYFEVERVWHFQKKELRELSTLRQANLSVRNFPATTDALRRRLRLADGGSVYLFATTLASGEKVLLQCKKTE